MTSVACLLFIQSKLQHKVMSTSTVLRVKRRLEDNPQDALVLMCKRIKTNAEEISPSLFVFRGTVDNKETTHLKDIVPKQDKALTPTHNVNDIIDKIRKERKATSTANRYELVNYSRGLDGTKEVTTDDNINLVELQQKTSDEEKDNVKYAYDLYIAAKEDFDISMLDNLVSIENYETDLIFGSYRDNGRKTPSSDGANDDDDDSNDENNWRNEYPDSEPSSIDEDDIVKAINNCNLDDELSSDAGEDKIYEEPADLFNEDVKRYGKAYCEYKARILKENPDLSNQSLIHCNRVKDLDEEALEGYKDDSDDGFYYGEEQDTAQFREQYASDEDDEENSAYSPD